jgi:hypothetical protein
MALLARPLLLGLLLLGVCVVLNAQPSTNQPGAPNQPANQRPYDCKSRGQYYDFSTSSHGHCVRTWRILIGVMLQTSGAV